MRRAQFEWLCAAGGFGVGVIDGKFGENSFSTAARISLTDAPDAYIWRDRVATSMQTAHSRPCSSHSRTSPLVARDLTKQS
jgi:hypothetical protein